MSAEISGLLSVRPVMASAVTSEVIEVPELVMKALDPSMTHSSPSSLAVVRIPPGMSDPPPALAELGEPPGLLLGRAEPVDGHRPECDTGLQRDRHRRVNPGQFVQGEAESEVITAHSAIFLGEGQAEQAELGHPG